MLYFHVRIEAVVINGLHVCLQEWFEWIETGTGTSSVTLSTFLVRLSKRYLPGSRTAAGLLNDRVLLLPFVMSLHVFHHYLITLCVTLVVLLGVNDVILVETFVEIR